MGRGLTGICGLDAKHATKQIDRLLSNLGINVEVFFLLGPLIKHAARVSPRLGLGAVATLLVPSNLQVGNLVPRAAARFWFLRPAGTPGRLLWGLFAGEP